MLSDLGLFPGLIVRNSEDLAMVCGAASWCVTCVGIGTSVLARRRGSARQNTRWWRRSRRGRGAGWEGKWQWRGDIGFLSYVAAGSWGPVFSSSPVARNDVTICIKRPKYLVYSCWTAQVHVMIFNGGRRRLTHGIGCPLPLRWSQRAARVFQTDSINNLVSSNGPIHFKYRRS